MNCIICLFRTFFPVVFIILFSCNTYAQVSENERTSLVILKLDAIDEKRFASAVTGFLKNKDFSLEYTCAQSGVVAFKLRHSFSEKADVKSFLMQQKDKLKLKGAFEVLFLDIQNPENIRKC